MTPIYFSAEEIFTHLQSNFNIVDAQGHIGFKLRDFSIVVEQNNVVGNILEEWIAKWMTKQGILHIHNAKQSAPDFWLNPNNLDSDWLEVKSFTKSPNFDISSFRSYINEIVDHPWKLHSKYLLLKYNMDCKGIVTIENCWLKNVWEISCTSKNWPLKVQYKNKTIVNIRPATWYSNKMEYPIFECLEDFLAALEETVYRYHDTRHLAENWSRTLCQKYESHYGVPLRIPRWMDIKDKYLCHKTKES